MSETLTLTTAQARWARSADVDPSDVRALRDAAREALGDASGRRAGMLGRLVDLADAALLAESADDASDLAAAEWAERWADHAGKAEQSERDRAAREHGHARSADAYYWAEYGEIDDVAVGSPYVPTRALRGWADVGSDRAGTVAPAAWQMAAAMRTGDRSTRARVIAAGLGLSAADVDRLRTMGLDAARDALPGMVRPGLSEPRHDVSADWEAVAKWQTLGMGDARPDRDRDRETIPADAGTDGYAATWDAARSRTNRRKSDRTGTGEYRRDGQAWAGLAAGESVTIPRPLDGPGTVAMLTMATGRLASYGTRQDRPYVDPSRPEVTAEVSPSVMSSGKFRGRGEVMPRVVKRSGLPVVWMGPAGRDPSPILRSSIRPDTPHTRRKVRPVDSLANRRYAASVEVAAVPVRVAAGKVVPGKGNGRTYGKGSRKQIRCD